MDKEVKISVIIPVYNSERFIRRCLNSLVSQSIFCESELIVVNDGSTDNTKKILEEYTNIYKNIKVFNIPNGGVSNARNYGMKQAVGLYITFVDADDWVDKDCYHYLLSHSKDEDIIAAGYSVVFESGKEVINNISNETCDIPEKESMKRFLNGRTDVHACTKLFRKSLIQDIEFDSSLNVAEDRVFTCQCIAKSRTTLMVSGIFYYYYQNSASVMHENFSEKRFDDILAGNKIIEIVKEKNPCLLPYAECMMIHSKCRLLGELYHFRDNKKYTVKYNELKKEIQQFSLIKGIKYSSKKHWLALLLAKIHPGIYNKMRSNQVLKFTKG